MKRATVLAATILIAAAGCGAAAAAAPGGKASYCGNVGGSNAPAVFDYRKGKTEYAMQLAQTERNSFSPDVESGARGPSSAQELDRTLQIFPNHTPALAALARLALKEKQVRLPGASLPVECYFDRAQRFAPDDAAVYTTYANYLVALGLNAKAVEMYTRASELDPANPVINYNLGLALVKARDFERANKHAQRAYAAGFPLPGLKTMLTQAGQWRELPPEAAPAPVPVVEAAAQPEPKKE
ncbi:tetratricopeptide repeat protein [Pseudoduganella namucuonensis]|uniref:TPR repeat-containing protein n=1 Tax=Pseudoduganella namucuonensis TaxID=1035707 RepID=A0A1I7GGR8_9BURK|nr:tetratricopeptide repeat protein [Pseudoduganella namucuonensis]SFU47677.1 TPR repeat-containing protein [Pseudoduganella namucuonensis]